MGFEFDADVDVVLENNTNDVSMNSDGSVAILDIDDEDPIDTTDLSMIRSFDLCYSFNDDLD